jgi:hypothetical protein
MPARYRLGLTAAHIIAHGGTISVERAGQEHVHHPIAGEAYAFWLSNDPAYAVW